VKVENGQPVLYLRLIEYVHAVTETQTNPQTGQQETVVVRQEGELLGTIAGAAAGSIAGRGDMPCLGLSTMCRQSTNLGVGTKGLWRVWWFL